VDSRRERSTVKKKPVQTVEEKSVLTLRRETLLLLEKSELQVVAGGGVLIPPIGYYPDTTG
jgi:hypothetical protein